MSTQDFLVYRVCSHIWSSEWPCTVFLWIWETGSWKSQLESGGVWLRTGVFDACLTMPWCYPPRRQLTEPHYILPHDVEAEAWVIQKHKSHSGFFFVIPIWFQDTTGLLNTAGVQVSITNDVWLRARFHLWTLAGGREVCSRCWGSRKISLGF